MGVYRKRLERLCGSHPQREKDVKKFEELRQATVWTVEDVQMVAARAIELEKMLSETELECGEVRDELDAKYDEIDQDKSLLKLAGEENSKMQKQLAGLMQEMQKMLQVQEQLQGELALVKKQAGTQPGI